MQPAPQTGYADVGGASIAYQVFGAGGRVLLTVTNWSTNIEGLWSVDAWVDFIARLTRFMRVVVFDQRGTGQSDRIPILPGVADHTADIRAVIDAIGASSVTILASDMAATPALAFAAAHPDRVDAIILLAPTVRLLSADDYPPGLPVEADSLIDLISEGWGVPDSAYNVLALPNAGPARTQLVSVQRQAATPNSVPPLVAGWLELDGREYVSKVTAPTLILHRTDDRLIPIAQGRWIAEHMPAGTFVEVPGDEHFLFVGDTRPTLQAIEQFLFGETGRLPIDGSLAALVVTDIVDSTGRAAREGADEWRAQIDRHDLVVRRAIQRYGGREVAVAGDSFQVAFTSGGAAVAFALAVRDEIRALGLDLRVGVHLGEVEERNGLLHGLALHVVTRVQAACNPGEVLVTAGIRDALVGVDGLAFVPHGDHELRGVPGRWRLYQASRP